MENKEIYSFIDITKRFTAIVGKYIDAGMTLSCSMTSLQNEVIKADLTDGKDTYRVYVYIDYDHFDDDYELFYSCYSLMVEKFAVGYIDRHCSLWNGKGETVYKEIFYEVEKDVYVNDSETMMEILKKRNIRRRNRHLIDYHITSDKVKKLVLPLVRRQERCKTKRITDIRSVERIAGSVYITLYNGTLLKF